VVRGGGPGGCRLGRGGRGDVVMLVANLVEILRNNGHHTGEEHIIQEQSYGHYHQHQLPGLPGVVEVGADLCPGHILAYPRLAHPQVGVLGRWVGWQVLGALLGGRGAVLEVRRCS